MPEGHEIPEFEQKRGPGRPRKVEAVVEAPVEALVVEPQEPVQAVPSKMVKIIIHPSEDGADTNPLNVPDPSRPGHRKILPRNKEIEIERSLLPLLDSAARIQVVKEMELDESGRPAHPVEVPKPIRRCPYTIIG